MNARVQELAAEAKANVTPGLPVNQWISEYNRIFAELIVRECIEVIDITHDSKKLMRPDPYQKIIWAIEEHFGIER
jgi:hypothetical protein